MAHSARPLFARFAPVLSCAFLLSHCADDGAASKRSRAKGAPSAKANDANGTPSAAATPAAAENAAAAPLDPDKSAPLAATDVDHDLAAFYIYGYPPVERPYKPEDLELVSVEWQLRYNAKKPNVTEMPSGVEADLYAKCRVKGQSALFDCNPYVSFQSSNTQLAYVGNENSGLEYAARDYSPHESGHLVTRGEGKVVIRTRLYSMADGKFTLLGDGLATEITVLPAPKPESFILDSARLAEGEEVPVAWGGYFGRILMATKDGWTLPVRSTIASSDESIVKVYNAHQWSAEKPGKATITITLPPGYGGSATAPVLKREMTVLTPKSFALTVPPVLRTACNDGEPSMVPVWKDLWYDVRVDGLYEDARGRSFRYGYADTIAWRSSDQSIIREIKDSSWASVGYVMGGLQIGTKTGKLSLTAHVAGKDVSRMVEVAENAVVDVGTYMPAQWSLAQKVIISPTTSSAYCVSGNYRIPSTHKISVQSANEAVIAVSAAADGTLLMAKSRGEAKVTVTYDGGPGRKATHTYTVTVK